MSAQRRETFFDPSAELVHPLQFAEYSQKVFANGSLYDEETSYDFNIRKLEIQRIKYDKQAKKRERKNLD